MTWIGPEILFQQNEKIDQIEKLIFIEKLNMLLLNYLEVEQSSQTVYHIFSIISSPL